MGTQPEVRDLIERRRSRAIKAILRAAETSLFPHVTQEAAVDFRRVVLDELNDLGEVALQVLASLANGNELNEHWLRLIEEMHGVIVAAEA